MVSETEDPQDLQGSSLQVESVETVSEIFLYNTQYDKKQQDDLHWYELIIHTETLTLSL